MTDWYDAKSNNIQPKDVPFKTMTGGPSADDVRQRRSTGPANEPVDADYAYRNDNGNVYDIRKAEVPHPRIEITSFSSECVTPQPTPVPVVPSACELGNITWEPSVPGWAGYYGLAGYTHAPKYDGEWLIDHSVFRDWITSNANTVDAWSDNNNAMWGVTGGAAPATWHWRGKTSGQEQDLVIWKWWIHGKYYWVGRNYLTNTSPSPIEQWVLANCSAGIDTLTQFWESSPNTGDSQFGKTPLDWKTRRNDWQPFIDSL